MALDKTPRQNRIREALGRIYDQHPPHFKEYLTRFQEDPSSRVFAPLAEAYRRMGRHEEAISICKQGLEHHPDFHGGRVALAKCYIDRKLYENAKRELEIVVAALPENLLAQRLLGDMYLALEDKRSAVHAYKMALLLSPADVALSEKVYGLERTLESEATIIEKESRAALDIPVEKVEVVEEPTTGLEKEHTVTHEIDLADAATYDLSKAQTEASIPPQAEEILSPPIEVNELGEESFEDDFMVVGPVKSQQDEEVIASDPSTENEINRLLGVSGNEEDDSFQVQRFDTAFAKVPELHKEITTATLGELYLEQGQFQQAREIFEKLYRESPTEELLQKVELCRTKLGVDRDSLVRVRQIELLRGILRHKHLLEVRT